jgi:hypothetical protein
VAHFRCDKRFGLFGYAEKIAGMRGLGFSRTGSAMGFVIGKGDEDAKVLLRKGVRVMTVREGLQRKAHSPYFGRGLAAESPTRRGAPFFLFFLLVF